MEPTISDRRYILIGADPEVFVRNSRTGEYIAAYGMPGSKAKPMPKTFGALQVDGCALEFNIHPAKNRNEFLRNLYMTYADLQNELQIRYAGCELVTKPLAEFKPDYWKTLPKEVKIMGCDPDFSAYTLRENKMPRVTKPVRSAGGHIHVGWATGVDPMNLNHMYECAAIVRQLDATLFLGSLMFDHEHRRRELYGKPGSFRPKEYGVEYRVLSNKWVSDSSLAGWVYDTTHKAIAWMNQDLIVSEDDYLKNCIQAALKKPHIFYADKREHKNAYKYLTGLGMPALPDEYVTA